jgi:SAM-dependent methyltransferase
LIKELQRTRKLCASLDAAGCGPAPGARILEIGCAFGLIVSTIAEHYQAAPFGVEPSALAAGFATTLGGVEVIAPTIDRLSETAPEQPMDMILFSHVMENVVDLNKVFAALDRWLAPHGIVLMETPNSTVKDSTHIYHPYCFSRTSLQRLFDSHGFEIVSLRASGRPSSVLLPRYLTLVARRRSMPGKNIKAGRNSGQKIDWGRRMGHGWRRLINGTPLVHLDRILTALLYAPDAAAKQRASELAKAHAAADNRG